MQKGAIHIHSTYSDGEYTLYELREIYASIGCSFVCVTDHAEAFDQEKLKRYRDECALLSGTSFCFLPGIEYECDRRIHILGYGVTLPANSTDPEEVIRHIDGCGGVSVIAHPRDDAFAWIYSFQVLPQGIETWNSKYDGRYAPRPATFHLLAKLQQRKPNLHAFYGQDLHWRKQFRGLFTWVDCDVLTQDRLLAALARGSYYGLKGKLQLPSNGHLPEQTLERFAGWRRYSDGMRRFVMSANQVSKQLGLTVPPRVKAQLRRIF